MSNQINQRLFSIATSVNGVPITHVRADYDKEADVLYLSFRKPQNATKTIEGDDDILIRTDGDEIVGLTILNAGSR